MPAIPANTKLLLHLDNANTDSSSLVHTMTSGANITYSAVVKKIGTHSALFDGTAASFISAPDHADFTLGTNDFTVEAYVYYVTRPSSNLQVIMSQYDQTVGNAKAWRFYLNHDGATYNLRFQSSTNGTSVATTLESDALTVNASTWYHFRFVRASNIYYFFQEGVGKGSGAFADNIANVNQIAMVGASLTAGAKAAVHNGYIDEPLFVNGTALSTGDFTPPTTAYGASTGIPGALSMLGCGAS